jgi:CRP-like cAMP-binding protein
VSLEDDIAVLEQVAVLNTLGRRSLRALAMGVETSTIEKGRKLFDAGDPADAAYIVLSGSFELVSGKRDDAPLILGPYTMLGELALLTETLRPLTAVARETSEVMRVPRSLFIKMLEGYPDTAMRMRDIMIARATQWSSDLRRVRGMFDPSAKR